MRPLMKKPMYGGFGRRNGTPEVIKAERALKLQSKLDAEILRKQKPPATPKEPKARVDGYRAQNDGRPLTPAQKRRIFKKTAQWTRGKVAEWHRPGSDVLTAVDESRELDLPEWNPEECSCHISPPCGYCEGGGYKEL
jgi:hypothetical protein